MAAVLKHLQAKKRRELQESENYTDSDSNSVPPIKRIRKDSSTNSDCSKSECSKSECSESQSSVLTDLTPVHSPANTYNNLKADITPVHSPANTYVHMKTDLTSEHASANSYNQMKTDLMPSHHSNNSYPQPKMNQIYDDSPASGYAPMRTDLPAPAPTNSYVHPKTDQSNSYPQLKPDPTPIHPSAGSYTQLKTTTEQQIIACDSPKPFKPVHNLGALESMAKNPIAIPNPHFEVVPHYDASEPETPDFSDTQSHDSDPEFENQMLMDEFNEMDKKVTDIEAHNQKIEDTIAAVLAMAHNPQHAMDYDDAQVSRAFTMPRIQLRGVEYRPRTRAPNGQRTIHACEFCFKDFPTRAQYEKHMRTHTGEKPFSCEICEQSFARKDRVRVHMRTHTGEKPYVCENCESAFTTREQLVKHIKYHTGERPYICTECDKRFAENSDLKRHLLTHTDEKPFECTVCGRAFKRKYALMVHNRIHTDERPYTCLTCDKAFHTSSHLSSHIQSSHL